MYNEREKQKGLELRAGDSTKVKCLNPNEDTMARIQKNIDSRPPFEREGFSMYEALNPKMRVDDKSKWRKSTGFSKVQHKGPKAVWAEVSHCESTENPYVTGEKNLTKTHLMRTRNK